MYGNKYIPEIINRLNSLKAVYVTDKLEDYVGMHYNPADHSISINTNFIDFKNGINITPAIEHMLIHELMHAASDKLKYNGVRFGKNAPNTAINEGITQMITDDIVGYVENKYLRSYNELKIVAKILRTTFGNETIINSYISDSDELRIKIEELSKDNDYYNKLLSSLVILNKLYVNRSKSKYEAKRTFDTILNRKFDSILREMVIKIVIPKLLQLNKKGKQNYLKSLILDISADNRVKREVISIISDYMDKTDIELINELNKLKEENDKINKESYFVSLVKEDEDVNNCYYVKNNGDVYEASSDGFKISTSDECSLVYSKLFDSSYSYDKSFYENIIDNLKDGKPLNIKYQDIKTRRIVYSGIRHHLHMMGYILLNDYRELDNHYKISKPIFIKNHSFNDLFLAMEVLYDKYSVSVINHNFVVKDIVNNFEVDSEYNKSYIRMAHLWAKALPTTRKEDLFSDDNRKKFIEIMKIIEEEYNSKEEMDLISMLNRCNNNDTKTILGLMFYNPSRVEIIYDLLLYSIGKPDKFPEKKCLSYVELGNLDYYSNQAKKEANALIK